MNYKFCKIFAGLLLVGATACTANYEEINSNPYQPGSLAPDDYALGSAMNAMAGCVISSDVNTTQFTDCLLGGTQGGYFADANADFAEKSLINYNLRNDWSRVFLLSDEIIPKLYKNLSIVRNIADISGDKVPYALGMIIKVATMHRVTDTYGPIPYSKIGVDGKINTPYDSQEDIYNKFFEELDEAIRVLTEHQNDKLLPRNDYVYGGVIKNWIKYANSLKLRLAIRIANVKPELAKQMAEEAVNHEIGVITTNAENASWKYFGSITNPMKIAVEYNMTPHKDGTPCTTSGDNHISADLVSYMNAYKDPRRDSYFSKSEWPSIDYVGMRRGGAIPDHGTVGHKYSGIKIAADAPLMWMSSAEVAFLRAEGIAIYGFDLGGSAENFYNEGIRLSFEQWGVDGYDAYMAQDAEQSFTYTDPNNGIEDYKTAIKAPSVKWVNGSKEEMQQRIITQKWLAIYPLGTEAWADYRRTGYPTLIPVRVNKSPVVDVNRGARRMPYPLEEFTSNNENVSAAIANYLNGPDNMATDLWWARKN